MPAQSAALVDPVMASSCISKYDSDRSHCKNFVVTILFGNVLRTCFSLILII